MPAVGIVPKAVTTYTVIRTQSLAETQPFTHNTRSPHTLWFTLCAMFLARLGKKVKKKLTTSCYLPDSFLSSFCKKVTLSCHLSGKVTSLRNSCYLFLPRKMSRKVISCFKKATTNPSKRLADQKDKISCYLSCHLS